MDYFRNSYQYRWSNIEEITNFLKYHNASENIDISFSTPILTCYGCLGSGWSKLFEMNVLTNIYRTKTQKKELLDSNMYRYEDVGERELWKSFHSGPTSIVAANNDVYYATSTKAYLRKISSSNGDGKSEGAGSFSNYLTTTEILAKVESENNKTISFTLPALSVDEIDAGIGYKYEVECVANPTNPSAMLGYYEATHDGYCTFTPAGLVSVTKYYWSISGWGSVVDASSMKITTTLYHQDMTTTSEGGPLITKGVKYSAYQLLRKAMLTCDTYILDNETTSLDEYNNGVLQDSIKFPIILDESWVNRLQVAKINETIFEVSNLWEVLIQIGYYLHAIPYLEFAEDGTDRFVLKFKQLGAPMSDEQKPESSKITIFNSRNLSDFFTQYDSYVTNLFSPQNLIEEWVVPKTSDSSFLVSNNSAELQLSYAITEIVEFDISLKLPSGEWDTRPALEYIFEKSIYDIISNGNPYEVFPSKGSAVYYNLGDNKIQGLNFVPPCANAGDLPMALKRIVQLLWQGTDIGDIKSIKYNELKFHVKYRTQDTARINQFRPDLESFMKNSSLEKYPHHEQFYNQQGKIIDSERFSANLYGRLIRVGNGIYQKQEYALPGSEKESGELVLIDREPYYITAIDNEFYPDAIFQKVTYSKNFNQLSNIVTIPSEPRFYEVSERSKIRREVRVMDFFSLSTKKPAESKNPIFLNNDKWKEFIRSLIFNDAVQELPNHAWTRFAVDKKRKQPYDYDKMFPSSLLDRSGATVRPAGAKDHVDVIVPLLHFPLHDGIVFTWSMFDNFKAGDFVDTHKYYDEDNPPTIDAAYLSVQPMRYVDIYGRADLLSFKLFTKNDWEHEQAQQLPRGDIFDPAKEDCIAAVQGSDSMFIALDKDCREEISINYHINLLHKVSEEDENFITFPNLFGQKESGKLKVALLNEPQSLFNENQNITNALILADSDKGEIDYELLDGENNSIELKFSLNTSVDMSKVKSIVLYQGELATGKFAYIIKNVNKLSDEDKLQSWYIYPVYTD